MNAIAAEELDLAAMTAVVVGDRAVVAADLAGQGYEVVLLDEDGDPLADAADEAESDADGEE